MKLHALFLLSIISNTYTTEPGFRFQVTQKGINYARDVLIPILTDAIKTAKIPDISQRVDTPVGHIHFSLSSVRITGVDVSNTNVKLVSPSNVEGAIANAKISLHANWHYREDSWPHISDSGSVDMSASSISVSLNILVDTTSTGQPHVSPKTCNFNVGSLSVTFHGGASWLYNLFSSYIESSIKDEIKSQVCPLVNDEIKSDVNSILSTVDLKTDIDDHCYIDYSLVQAPFVIKDALFVNGKGEIVSKANPSECPSPKQELPQTVNDSKMVTLWVTEYMLNSAGYAYQQADFLQYNLTSDDIPSEVPIHLTTDFFKYFIPPLYQAYPDKNLSLWINVTKPITLDVNTAGVSGIAEGVIVWYVLDEKNAKTEAFRLDAQLDLCVNISVHLGAKSEIYLDLITVEPNIQLKSSNIGNFSVSALESFVKLSRTLIVPFINGMVKNGIPLPSFDDIAFSGFDFSLENGYLQIYTDIKYTPSLSDKSSHEVYTLFDEGFECKMKRSGVSKLVEDILHY